MMLNEYPYNVGHLLVVPYRHVATLVDLTSQECVELMQLMQRATHVLQEIMEPDGINLGINLGLASGASIPDHLHVHIVPRFKSDNGFMEVINSTRVLSVAFHQVYLQLKDIF